MTVDVVLDSDSMEVHRVSIVPLRPTEGPTQFVHFLSGSGLSGESLAEACRNRGVPSPLSDYPRLLVRLKYAGLIWPTVYEVEEFAPSEEGRLWSELWSEALRSGS
jgi:hypothetical protein